MPSEDDRAPAHPDTVAYRQRLSSPASAVDPDGVGPTFTVLVTLRDAPSSDEELQHEIGNQLDHFDAHFARDSTSRTVVTLQTLAADLWVAVLLAMSAVTQTGYQPERIEAMPWVGVKRSL